MDRPGQDDLGRRFVVFESEVVNLQGKIVSETVNKLGSAVLHVQADPTEDRLCLHSGLQPLLAFPQAADGPLGEFPPPCRIAIVLAEVDTCTGA